ncbi:hypothetical protein BDB01DRAFT_445034 [Pilobolus umbonatus]|nr:hypothetical protein BDB01DRAFT_445034 [Pilobolus umbonatus]
MTKIEMTLLPFVNFNCKSQVLDQESLINGLGTRMETVKKQQVKLYSAAKSGGLAGRIIERTTQKWVKRLKEDKDWNILETQTNKVNLKKKSILLVGRGVNGF